jgi:DNA-binding ferritin-like protein
MANYEKPVAQFVAVLLHSGTVTHMQHLATKSYAQHVALGEFYNAIIELADTYAEAYTGAYQQIPITAYSNDFSVTKDPEAYLQMIKRYVDVHRKDLPDDTALQNIVDEIVGQIDSTLYKLRFLS